MKHQTLVGVVALVLLMFGLSFTKPNIAQPKIVQVTVTPTLKKSKTPTVVVTATQTLTPVPSTATLTPTLTDTPGPTDTPTPTETPAPPTPTHLPTATGEGGPSTPYPEAPLCPDSGAAHDNSLFHALWDAARGCHYDHEHGMNAYTSEVAAAFPGFDFQALQGGAQIGHTNPSGAAENVAKHGGFKVQVDIDAPNGCEIGFESGTVAVDAYAIQYHAFGNLAIELDADFHSATALLRQCKPGDPSDKGYVFLNQFQDYGQNVVPYQGDVMLYPNRPMPGYEAGFAPYWSVDCIGTKVLPQAGQCRSSLDFILDRNLNVNSIVTSKSTAHIGGSSLLGLLFRVRDDYQAFDWSDQVHPFTFFWICGGTTYAPFGCRYNNSTGTIHEVQGRIPAAWDNLAGFDTDSEVGRITADGFVTGFGALAPDCVAPGSGCHPIKLLRAFVGLYSSELSEEKVSNPTVFDTRERDQYFCGGAPCFETDPGAVPSSWIGPSN